jgi:hypothetical protein
MVQDRRVDFTVEAGSNALSRIRSVYVELEQLEASGQVPDSVRDLMERMESAAALMGAVIVLHGGVGALPPRGPGAL